MALKDPDIRSVLRGWIRTERGGLVADEIPVHGGKAMIDLVAFTDQLHSYEIKGQTDRLTRLKNQTLWFSKVSQYCTVVTTKNHIKNIGNHIPDWWEIILAKRDYSDRVVFEIIREGEFNPSLDLRSIAELLWKVELTSFLERKKLPTRKSWNKVTLLRHFNKFFEGKDEALWITVMDLIITRQHDPVWRDHHMKD